MGWRLINSENTDPFYVTAVDEAIAIAKKEKKTPNTLHFYQRNPAAVSIGRSRKIGEDVNVKECNNHNIKIVRRTTGGGTIYTDKDCLIYSLVFPKDDLKVFSYQDIFQQICGSLVSAFKKLNIETLYKPPNDILLNGKKISGSAQILKENIVLNHGTILLDTNLDIMHKVLKQSNSSYVSSIKKETKATLSVLNIKETMKKEFEDIFDTEIVTTPLSSYEIRLIEKLLKERYGNDAWNYVR